LRRLPFVPRGWYHRRMQRLHIILSRFPSCQSRSRQLWRSQRFLRLIPPQQLQIPIVAPPHQSRQCFEIQSDFRSWGDRKTTLVTNVNCFNEIYLTIGSFLPQCMYHNSKRRHRCCVFRHRHRRRCRCC
jgi:hypothetical protein